MGPASAGVCLSAKTWTWILDHGASTRSADAAAKAGNHGVLLELILNDVYPSSSGANAALCRGHSVVCDMMADFFILPDVCGVNDVARHGDLDKVTWAVRHGACPNESGVASAIRNGHWHVIAYLCSVSIYPSPGTANHAAKTGRYRTLVKLAGVGVYPDPSVVTVAAANGQLDVVAWMCDTLGVFPEPVALDSVIRKGRFCAAKYLIRRGMPVSERTRKNLVEYGRESLLSEAPADTAPMQLVPIVL